MDGKIDIITLLFLVLAVVIFLKLRNVLGRRTGNERPPFDPYAKSETEAARTEQTQGEKVITLPRREQAQQAAAATAEDSELRIKTMTDKHPPAAAGLADIARADASFDPDQFLRGARVAYEMIIGAFAQGDRKELKKLLSREVYEGFSAVISEREARQETVESNFVGIRRADIVDAALKDRIARVTVKFISELYRVTRRGEEIVEGDPKQKREVTDIWTFARDVGSRDPNWKLVATASAS